MDFVRSRTCSNNACISHYIASPKQRDGRSVTPIERWTLGSLSRWFYWLKSITGRTDRTISGITFGFVGLGCLLTMKQSDSMLIGVSEKYMICGVKLPTMVIPEL